MSNIIPFNYESKEIRVVQDENGNLWWVVKDICSVLGLTDTGRAIQILDKDESKTFRVTDRLGRKQDTYIISEPGLYRLLSRSNKEEAKKFQRWIFHDVLPSIRKTGQ
jgi:prophage antirepressor-like protein